MQPGPKDDEQSYIQLEKFRKENGIWARILQLIPNPLHFQYCWVAYFFI